MSSQFIDKFKQLDAYAKPLEDFRIKTATGAAISVVSGIVALLLFISEIQTYMSPNVSEELFVDTTRGHKLRINLDIIIPTISCDYIVLDAMDSSGEQHLSMEQNIHKRRLDLKGNPITEEEPKKQEIAISTIVSKIGAAVKNVMEVEIKSLSRVAEFRVKENKTDVATFTCGSCYGAALNESQCCNTCEDVKEAYKVRKWALPDFASVEQCKNDESIERTNLALKEGCQLYGYMEVNRVGGSFHIAPGKSFTVNHVHVHDVQPYSSSVFNTTHIIKHLSFGSEVGSVSTAPLNGVTGVAKEGAVMFQYYLKIIPTLYVNLMNKVVNTNQFSVTRHQKYVSNPHADAGMPGVFFSYELSPLMVKYTEKGRSIGHLATNICAIFGGVGAVAGILDALLYHSLNALKNKILLGKTG